MTKAILFDFFGVLTTKGGWPYVAETIAKSSGVDVEAISNKIHSSESEYILGKESTQSFWKEVCMGLNTSLNEFEAALGEYELNDKLLDVLSDLKQKYRLIIVSDNYEIATIRIKKDPKLVNLFEKMFFSNEEGLTKRSFNTDFYIHVLKDLGLSPSECIFTDDNSNNVQAAASIGLKTILFNNTDQFKQDLMHFLI